LELRYRVVVPVDDETAQVQVRSLVPDAFRTVHNGRVMMQVGAYSDRIKAEEMQQMITSKGLQATIEQAN
jgi:cell division protein FtsN